MTPCAGVTAPRIGLLGGTFDPPHYGHLVAAQEVAWRLDLERVLFLPARQNPLKADEPVTPPDQRCAMVELAIAGDTRFQLSTLDLDRPPPSYTVDLLVALHDRLGADAALFFVVGGDILGELPRWHHPRDVVRLATLAVVGRPGWPAPDVAAVERSVPGASGRIVFVPSPGVDVASTEIRRRVRAGQPIRYLTPPAVERYIAERGLYGPARGG